MLLFEIMSRSLPYAGVDTFQVVMGVITRMLAIYLPYISPTSRLYLACISPTSPLYLAAPPPRRSTRKP